MGDSEESVDVTEGEGKIQRSKDIKLRQIHVTEEERKYRDENFDEVDLMNDHEKYLVCTRCDSDFRRTIKKGGTVMVHPLLGVLMCNSCCDYFGDGNFSMDSEGEDKYCRWCGDGGTIFVCSKCNFGFCDACIKKHFNESGLEEVKNNDNWICYFCNPKPLWYLRSLCSLAQKAAKNKRNHLKRKEGRKIKKERRKKESDESGTYGRSSDEDNNGSGLKRIRRGKCLRKVEKVAADESSSSSDEDVLEKHTNLRKRRSMTRKQPPNEEKKEQSPDSSTRTRKKRMKIARDSAEDSENKKLLLLEKVKSIWKLIESVLEAGLASSREKVKHLSKNWKFKNLESLKREHEDLKACISVLATSMNSASNSVNAIKDDLTFDTAKNESEIIRRQEMKIKRFAKKFQKQSQDETSADSDGNTSQNELKEKERPAGDAEAEETGMKSGKGSEGGVEENERGKNVSEGEGEVGNANGDGTKDDECDSGKKSSPVKPLLKVKSFARMLNDNVYDNENSSAVEVYDVETDDSENERQTNEGNKKEPSKEKKKEKVSDDAKKKSKDSPEDKEVKKISDARKGEKKIRKKKKPSEIEDEESEESGKNLNQEDNPVVRKKNENENAKEPVSRGEERSENESENENEKEKEKEKKNSSHESQKSSEDEEISTRRTRNSKKGKSELKASFEKYKQKREKYLRSTKESKRDEEKVKETKVLESCDSGSDAEKKGKLKNRRPKKKHVLASSDEENGEKAETKSSGGEEGKGSDEETSDEAKTAKNSEVESEKENQNRKSDAAMTSGSTSEEEFDTRKRKRIRKRKKGSSDSGEDEGKKKRRKAKGGSSDSSGDEENKKSKKGRKNIKKILKKDSLQVETKEALKNEEERKKRLKEKQKLFEELFPEAEGNKSRQLILDFDPETKEPLVTIHKKLAKRLKPHQLSGVKFMWDNCFESVQRLEEESGSGCILAHCMGLGKTLQVVTLVHTVMTHDLGVHSVLIVCPLSTVSNWIREFETWLGNIHTEPITLYDLVRYKKPEERRMHLEDWHKNGGVLVLSYDLFRNLTKSLTKHQKDRKKKLKRVQMAFGNALLDPGPDLVVCDEGHLLKNEDTALSKCMSRLKTARRIVLTGTPLQNNLIEYHCMVQFVKPNILGTRKEFCNRFVNPINNGQFEDSTELDVKIMKRRSHVLHSMLEGCIQRFDYSVLTPFLPEKHEYVLQIALTDTQAKVYLHFIKNLSAKSSGSSRATSLFNDYHSLQRIWTHPRTLLMQKERENQREALASDSEGSLKDFVVSSDEETSRPGSDSSDDSKPEVIEPKKRLLRSNANDPEMRKMIEEEEKQQNKTINWWDEFYDENAYDDLRESNKLVLLFDLLKYCREVKDKVLVFSQSLYSLDLIEYFLAKVDENSKKNDETLCGHQDSWILGSDYFRLDGSTSSETREVWCKTFNKETNSRGRLFLISTRAGGLGINLYGANRVVIFDASWNPSHDLQSIFRVYRFGQKKPCYIYRFLSEATMEEKIYERQVTKLSLAHRVVDEHQIERHYTMGNLQELYTFEPTPKDQRKVPNLPKDPVLADLLANHKDVIVGYHEHDSLLENKQEEELSEEERKAAWREYEEEKVQRTYNANAGTQHDMLLSQQAQQQFMLMVQQQQLQLQQRRQQQQGEGTIRFINPAHPGLRVNPNLASPIYPPPNIPLDVLQRGFLVGLTPLPKETLDSFLKRIISRERGASTSVEPHQSSISYEVVRRFIRTEAFESPFGLQLLANILNDIIQGRKSEQAVIELPAEEKRAEDAEKLEVKSESASDSTVLYSPDVNKLEATGKEESGEADEWSLSSGKEASGMRNREGKRKGKGEEKDEEDKELEKLLRMTNIKTNARAESTSEEEKEKRKEKDKKNSKPQEEPSLLECMETENGNDSANTEPDLEPRTEEDFSSIINMEAKKMFLKTSEESSQSSENEEPPVGKEHKEKKESKEKRETRKRKKDDLSEFRISNLTDGEESSEKDMEDLSDTTYREESASNSDSDDSVMYVEHVKKRKLESSNNSEQTCGSDSGTDIEQVYSRTDSSPVKGRKNIKKILKKENLQVETKQALKMETERKKRVNERQKLFEEIFGEEVRSSNLILDFDPQTKEQLLVVDEKLTQQLKPHQKEGVRFMWNCCFESLKKLEEDSGSGCILAHCMGLGKTLQVVTLVHTILTQNTGVQTVMIMCPLNTIRNWMHEFRTWQKGCAKKVTSIDLIPLKSRQKKAEKVRSWSRDGGVLIIGYEMFRTLIKKDGKNMVFSNGFLDPGPDLVVCDEGHVLKNNNSALSKSISRIKTLRRIILTGTPLQNNLMEYYCMVQFVKPNILGTKREFNNRFVNPISNGQFEDSTQLDVRLMKRRAHVLHTMLDGFIQRFGYYVLTPFLPEKQEYVISIALTETQGNIYKQHIERCNQGNRKLLNDFHWTQQVWTHPRALLHRSRSRNDEAALDWWADMVPKEDFDSFRGSGKVFLLFDILRQCKKIGDKVLVFSQSLYSLDVIQYFLNKANTDYSLKVPTEFADSWEFGDDYFRLDGSTSSETRDSYCKRFNNPNNPRFRLLLISTRAGGLGINLVAANRVVVFDASWNPTHDVQSIFRVYRFGQRKPCYIYRFLAAATMEEKIYRRQVTKLSLAHRIVDEHQIERHYSMVNLQELYTYDPIPKSEWRSPKIPKDKLFAEVLANGRDIIVGYHEHDSLLENKEEEELTEEERRAAWEDYEKEKLTLPYPANGLAPEAPPFMDRITIEGLDAIYAYKHGFPAFPGGQVTQNENQMCRIVDVRTLQGENIYGDWSRKDCWNSAGL